MRRKAAGLKRIAVLVMSVGLVLGLTAAPASAEDLASLWNRTAGCDGLMLFCPGPMP
ncbi:MAG: hypothetical protein ACRD1T_16205 [Acidimicrobiia bacterium]